MQLCFCTNGNYQATRYIAVTRTQIASAASVHKLGVFIRLSLRTVFQWSCVCSRKYRDFFQTGCWDLPLLREVATRLRFAPNDAAALAQQRLIYFPEPVSLPASHSATAPPRFLLMCVTWQSVTNLLKTCAIIDSGPQCSVLYISLRPQEQQ